LIEHGLTSAPTQYRLYGQRFLQAWWPNQQCQSTEGGWLVIQTGLTLTRLTSPCYQVQGFTSHKQVLVGIIIKKQLNLVNFDLKVPQCKQQFRYEKANFTDSIKLMW